jgi:hypothetical protein
MGGEEASVTARMLDLLQFTSRPEAGAHRESVCKREAMDCGWRKTVVRSSAKRAASGREWRKASRRKLKRMGERGQP